MSLPSYETSPAAAARRLRDLGLKPNRRLSQSFLRDPHVAQAMVRAAQVASADTVLEIGPGLGILTQELVAAVARVVSVELDHQLAAALPAALGSPPNLEVVQGDANLVDLSRLVSEPYLVVASLPYHVATHILFRLAFERPRPTRIVAMLQEEVAVRVVGTSRAMTFLGAALSMVADTRLVRRVPPGAFFPMPKVKSAIVQLDLLEQPRIEVDDVHRFVAFLHAGFTQPRRQLHNSLSQGLDIPAAQVRELLAAARVEQIRRPADLLLSEWAAVYGSIAERGWLG